MLFRQLGRAHSLREIVGGLKSCAGKLSNLGIEAPACSTLSYANSNRPWQTFEKVFYGLYETVAAHSFKFGWSMSNLVVLLRMNLITYRNLMAWLDQPYAIPPDPLVVHPQTSLTFA